MTLNLMTLPNEEHPNNSVPRDGHGKPLVIPEGGGKPVALTRTTTFIDCIEDKSGLSNWKQRQTLRGAAMQPSILEAVEGLDPTDRRDKAKLDALAERAADVAGSNVASARGTHLHTLSEYVDRGEPLPPGTSEEDAEMMASYMIETSGLHMVGVEQFVVVPELAVGGTFDRTATFDFPCRAGAACPGRHIVDLKTGGEKAIEYGHLKMPAQLAVYSRGRKYDHTVFPAPIRSEDEKAWQAWRKKVVSAEEAAKAYTPLEDICQDWGVVIHLPQDGTECGLYWADLQEGWELALFAQQVRAKRGTKGTLIRFGVDNAA
ncbi:exonuclease [Streptomyces phage VieEnRose]|nr:exonuclease [Streptomyces phage VieEnRose]